MQSLWALGAPPPDPRAAGALAQTTKTAAPCEFLAMRLVTTHPNFWGFVLKIFIIPFTKIFGIRHWLCWEVCWELRRRPSWVWGQNPQHPKTFIFYCQNNLILGICWQKLMLFIRGIKANSGGIELSNSKTWLDSDAQPEIWNGWAVSRVWERSPQRSKIFFFCKKKKNFRPILIKINAFEMRHRN